MVEWVTDNHLSIEASEATSQVVVVVGDEPDDWTVVALSTAVAWYRMRRIPFDELLCAARGLRSFESSWRAVRLSPAERLAEVIDDARSAALNPM